MVGVKISVDLNKEKALGKPDLRTERQFGRLSIGDMKSLPQIKNLFSIAALAAATVAVDKVEFGLNTDFLQEETARLVPKLSAKIGVQSRKKFGIFNARRALRVQQDHRSPRSRSLDEHATHRAYPLVRSLLAHDIFDDTYVFDPCPVDLEAGVTFCGKVTDIMLDMEELRNLVIPIVKKFIRVDKAEKKGFLDEVIDPQLLVLDQRLPGISDIMGKKITVLDIAEAFLGKKSGTYTMTITSVICRQLTSSCSVRLRTVGAPTVRKILKIYRSLQNFAQQFSDNAGLLLAAECDMANKFKCTGGLTSSVSRRRLHQSASSIFGHSDSGGLPATPKELAEDERELGTCPTNFTPPTCGGDCSCSSAACRAKKLACRGSSIDGLSMPFMSNLPSVLGLLSGKDIVSRFDC